MRLYGQRWKYVVGNSTIYADNAFSWTLWGQERLIVNDEIVQRSSGGGLRLVQKYQEPWLTMVGESELRVELRSVLRGILCTAILDGEEIEPEDVLETSWTGARHSWPDDAAWQRDRRFARA